MNFTCRAQRNWYNTKSSTFIFIGLSIISRNDISLNRYIKCHLTINCFLINKDVWLFSWFISKSLMYCWTIFGIMLLGDCIHCMLNYHIMILLLNSSNTSTNESMVFIVCVLVTNWAERSCILWEEQLCWLECGFYSYVKLDIIHNLVTKEGQIIKTNWILPVFLF